MSRYQKSRVASAISDTLANLRNIFGPLPEDTRRALLGYVRKPTQRGWGRIYPVVINPNGRVSTVWQYVREVDPSFPRVGPYEGQRWSKIPDQVTLLRALRRAEADLNERQPQLRSATTRIRGEIHERVRVRFQGERTRGDDGKWSFHGKLIVEGLAGEGWGLQVQIRAHVIEGNPLPIVTFFEVAGRSRVVPTLWSAFFYDWLTNDLAVAVDG